MATDDEVQIIAICALTDLHKAFGRGSTTRLAQAVMAGFESANLTTRRFMLEYLLCLGDDASGCVCIVVTALTCPCTWEVDSDDEDELNADEEGMIGLGLMFAFEERAQAQRDARIANDARQEDIVHVLQVLRNVGDEARVFATAVGDFLVGVPIEASKCSDAVCGALAVLANFGGITAQYTSKIEGCLRAQIHSPIRQAAMKVMAAIAEHCVRSVDVCMTEDDPPWRFSQTSPISYEQQQFIADNTACSTRETRAVLAMVSRALDRAITRAQT